MNDWVAIALLIILLAGNAFFVAGEFAIMSTRRAQIEPLAEEGNKRAQTVIYALENVSLMLATCQLGITICSLLILNVSEPALHHMLEVPLHLVGLPHTIVDVLAFGITLILVTYLHVIFGEMVPKNAAVDEVASTFTLGELQTIVATSTAEGTVEDDAGVIESALEFTEKDVYEIMVPGDKLVTLPFGSTPAELERAVARSGYSRFVIADSDGTYMGYLHVKDALAIASERFDEPFPWYKLRSLDTLTPTTDIDDALASMQRSRTHIAQVMDEHGVTLGVVFLEDVLEELVGEINDTTQDAVRERVRRQQSREAQ